MQSFFDLLNRDVDLLEYFVHVFVQSHEEDKILKNFCSTYRLTSEKMYPSKKSIRRAVEGALHRYNTSLFTHGPITLVDNIQTKDGKTLIYIRYIDVVSINWNLPDYTEFYVFNYRVGLFGYQYLQLESSEWKDTDENLNDNIKLHKKAEGNHLFEEDRKKYVNEII